MAHPTVCGRVEMSALGLVLAVGAACHAQPCEPEWLTGPGQGMHGVHGAATDSIAFDPDGPGGSPELLIIGGHFDVVDLTPASNIAAWDGATWNDMGGGVSGGAIFDRVASFGTYNGELIVGGFFPTAGGVAANNIAAWDGANWKPLGDGVFTNFGDSSVDAMVEYEGKLHVAGFFNFAGGAIANHIATWDGASWAPLGIGTSFAVAALEVFQDELYVAGFFNDAGLVPNTRFIAKWDGAQWKSLGNITLPDHFVVALREYQGELFVGGSFNFAGNILATGLVKWTGTEWKKAHTGPGATLNGNTFALQTIDDSLYIGGGFTMAGGTPASGIARFDGASWHAFGAGLNGGAQTMTPYVGDLVVTGQITQAGGPNGVVVDRLAKWDGASWSRVASNGSAWRPSSFIGFEGELVATATEGIVAGTQTFAHRVVRREGSDWAPIGEVFNEQPWVLHVHDGELLAGGWFSGIGAVDANSVARWDGAAWRALGQGLTVGANFAELPSVLAFETFNGELYAGGDFLKSGAASTSLIARWDGSAWNPVGGGLTGGALPTVYDLEVFNGKLIAGGDFSAAGGQSASRIASWNGTAWQPLGAGVGGSNGQFFPQVNSLATHEGSLYVGGAFELAGGQAIPHIARWDGAAWHAVAPPLNERVQSLVVHQGEVYAGGAFTEIGPSVLGHVARLDPRLGWQPLGSGTNGPVHRLGSVAGQLYISGGFSVTGGKASVSWGRWGCEASACEADCDKSGGLDIDDFICFQTLFAIQDPSADCDQSGGLDIDDFICFQTLFAIGC